MNSRSSYSTLIAFAVALGGFLMGFDSAVISGVVDPIRGRFELDPWEVGFSVSCLTAGSTAAMAFAGPLADRFGRRIVLRVTALLFTLSAIASALATDFWFLIFARVVGGFGVGGALLIAPLFIAEIAPPEKRGRLVSFNQLNIVLGFSAAFFSNYFLNGYFSQQTTDTSDVAWRWMLGVEALPAIAYFIMLFLVPRSPRWLAMRGRDDEARAVLARVSGPESADTALIEVKESIKRSAEQGKVGIGELFHRRMKRVMAIGLGLALFQQITGINAVFYYATTIFKMAGAGREASLAQAILVGLVNVAFTVLAMWLIDRAGRRPLLIAGTAGMAISLLSTSWAFNDGTYQLQAEPSALETIVVDGNETLKVEGATVERIDGKVAKRGSDGSVSFYVDDMTFSADAAAALAPLIGKSFAGQSEFLAAVTPLAKAAGPEVEAELDKAKPDLAKTALELNGTLVLIAIMMFIASFAISLGPVMWAMFSEIFPMRLRGIAISAAGFFNSAISYAVQQLFPPGLATIGPAGVFLVFGSFAVLALLFSLFVVPETKGRTLEELESELIPD